MQIEVIRAFCIAEKPQAVGRVIDVDAALGMELIGLRKAIIASDTAPVQQDTKPAVKRAKKEITE